MLGHLRGKSPKLYGTVTVAERGQVVIPAEARRDLEIGPSTKLLVFSGPGKRGLMFVKAEAMTEFIAQATATLSLFEQAISSKASETTNEKR